MLVKLLQLIKRIEEDKEIDPPYRSEFWREFISALDDDIDSTKKHAKLMMQIGDYQSVIRAGEYTKTMSKLNSYCKGKIQCKSA
jgi:hypothetical protein